MAAPSGRTGSAIIQMAMEDAGYLEEGQAPNAVQLAMYLPRLNDLINTWQTGGLKVWLEFEILLTLVAGQKSYSLRPGGDFNIYRPMRFLDSAYYQDSTGNRRPVRVASRDEYMKLSNIINQGPINIFWPEKLYDRVNVSVWQTPDANTATGLLGLQVIQQIENLSVVTEALRFPPEWFTALHWGLSAEICTGQPASIVNRCEGKAAYYKDMLESFDVEEASTRFTPDPQIGYRSRIR